MSNARRITALPATAEGSAGIIASMTERGAPSADTSPACPFVAFEDERDERADRPDHRHRCYAEAEPAPRALAHQEAYCLSSAFPVCPTFQEWARREAAHTRAGGTATPTPTAAIVTSSDSEDGDTSGDDSTDHDNDDDDSWERRRDDRPIEERPRRNPPRDWAAPPPWAAGAGGLAGAAGGAAAAGAAGAGGGRPGSGRTSDGSGRPSIVDTPPEEGRGLVGSAADRLARGGHIADDPDVVDVPRIRHAEHPSTPADPELAGLVGARGSRNDPPPIARSGRQPTVSSTRDRDRDRERERERAAERSGPHDGPAWEGPRRYEAYPQIKARASMPGMPAISRIALLAGALAIAALALFFLPALLGVGGGNDAAATPSPTASATATPEPTPIPAPTPQVYTIKAGDTLSKIAKAFGVTVDDLLAANKDTIKNKDRIVVGNQITIPVPASNEVGGEASGSPAP
jgi:nucleoid-associated protein YgaU